MYWRHLFISYKKHCEKHKLPPDKERILSLGAILIHSNEDTERVLVTSKCRPFYREGMENGWDIVDRNSAITTINWCLEEGHSDYYEDRVQHFAEKSIDELDEREKEFFDDVEQY